MILKCMFEQVFENCINKYVFIPQGPELLSKYIGASEQAVRDTFDR